LILSSQNIIKKHYEFSVLLLILTITEFYIPFLGLFKGLTFAVTFIVILFNFLAIFKLYVFLSKKEFIWFLFFLFLIFLNPLYTGNYSLQLVKYLAYTLTFILGYLARKRAYNGIKFDGSKRVFVILAILPLAFYLINGLLYSKSAPSTFFGRNGLSGYFFSFFYYYLVFFIDSKELSNARIFTIIAVILFFIIMTATIGALLSFIAVTSFFLLYSGLLRLNRLILPLIIISSFLVIFSSHIPLFQRVEEMYNDAAKPLMAYRIMDLQHLEFKDFGNPESEEESETSLIFRIKHWSNIISVHSQSSLTTKIIGSGVEYIHTDMPLFMRKYPHNDYLRVLVENGVLVFLMIVFVYSKTIFLNLRRIELIPLASLVIFSSSENLLNNFLGMYLFFFTLGYQFKEQSEKLTIQSIGDRNL